VRRHRGWITRQDARMNPGPVQQRRPRRGVAERGQDGEPLLQRTGDALQRLGLALPAPAVADRGVRLRLLALGQQLGDYLVLIQVIFLL
jgi:hypothetical protein